MKVAAVIFDLDNTIYSVYSIGDELFRPLFDLIKESNEFKGNLAEIQRDVMRIPFQKVALIYQFSEKLMEDSLVVLDSLTADLKMNTFDDYETTKGISCKKFLVTVGFSKMQEGKIKSLGIGKDFHEIHIIDPRKSDRAKKDVFADIIKRHNLDPAEVIVVGDDPDSEIQAAKELGMQAVLYDKLNLNSHRSDLERITDFKQLLNIIG